MKNFVQGGAALILKAPTGGVKSGQGILIGSLFCIPSHDAVASEEFTANVEGCYILPKKADEAQSQGTAVYWDKTAKNVTITKAGNTFIGHAMLDVSNASKETQVRLVGGVEGAAPAA